MNKNVDDHEDGGDDDDDDDEESVFEGWLCWPNGQFAYSSARLGVASAFRRRSGALSRLD